MYEISPKLLLFNCAWCAEQYPGGEEWSRHRDKHIKEMWGDREVREGHNQDSDSRRDKLSEGEVMKDAAFMILLIALMFSLQSQGDHKEATKPERAICLERGKTKYIISETIYESTHTFLGIQAYDVKTSFNIYEELPTKYIYSTMQPGETLSFIPYAGNPARIVINDVSECLKWKKKESNPFAWNPSASFTNLWETIK